MKKKTKYLLETYIKLTYALEVKIRYTYTHSDVLCCAYFN